MRGVIKAATGVGALLVLPSPVVAAYNSTSGSIMLYFGLLLLTSAVAADMVLDIWDWWKRVKEKRNADDE